MHRWNALALVVGFIPAPTAAALPVGSQAPNFGGQSVLGGNLVNFTLDGALAHGPVVVFFFPAAFTAGSTNEIREFSDAIDDFRRAGTSVIGVSTDSMAKLTAFSKLDCCRSIPLTQALPSLVAGYGVALPGTGLTTRATLVIGRDRNIAYSFSSMATAGHVAGALATARALAGPPFKISSGKRASIKDSSNTVALSAVSSQKCLGPSVSDAKPGDDNPSFRSHFIRNTCSYSIVVSYCLVSSRLGYPRPDPKCRKDEGITATNPITVGPGENKEVAGAFTVGGYPIALIAESCSIIAFSSKKCVPDALHRWRELGSPSVSEDVPQSPH